MSKQFQGVDIDAVHGGQMAETRFLTFGEIINYRNHGDYPPLMDAAEFRKQICDLALKGFERVSYVSPRQIVEQHRRHVELSPGVGEEVQKYALAVCDDILADLDAAGISL